MSDVDELLNLIKDFWPKFTISKENLLRPTQEFVIRFYNNFITDHNERVASFANVPMIQDFDLAMYDPEEQLCIQLTRLLLKIDGLQCKLGDIVQPTVVRTKNFFKICIHFLAFTENIQNETEALESTVFKTNDNTSKLQLEQQQLIEEINELAKCKAQWNEDINLLQEETHNTKSTLNEIRTSNAAKEKLHAEKRVHIENLERDLQKEEYDMKRLENMKKDLLEQRIMQSDYEYITKLAETLRMESESLDNDDIGIDDGLVCENQVLQHTAECLRKLKTFDLNMANVEKFNCKEDELKVVSNLVNNFMSTKLSPVQEQSLKAKQKLATLEPTLVDLKLLYKQLKDSCECWLNTFSQEICKINKDFQDKSTKNSELISTYENYIEKLDKDMEEFKETFTKEYIKVSKAEKVVVDTFKETLMKCKDMM